MTRYVPLGSKKTPGPVIKVKSDYLQIAHQQLKPDFHLFFHLTLYTLLFI